MTDDHPKHYCGLFGVFGAPEASYLIYLGLYALQHRGEESCGIVTSDAEELYIHKDMGLVADVFNDENLRILKGDRGIGHVRYSTTGSSLVKNAQPLFVDYLGSSLAVAHNGNLVNSTALRKELERSGSIFQTSCDSEVIVHLMARSSSGQVVGKLKSALRKIQGAYSLVLLTQDELIGARDPEGFRPLCLGRKGDSWCLASETCAFDLIEAKFVREVEPGEIVVISRKGIESIRFASRAERSSCCIFEHIYFARPDSVIFGETVHLVRRKLGETLAKEHPVDADYVVPIPDSGTSAALGFSRASGIPLEWGAIRNHYVGRTFIQPHQNIRDLGVKVKINILREVVAGKKVVIVDDSIVRGTTSRIRVNNFRAAGAKEVHMRVSCPPHRFPCFYGIDFPSPDELIANRYSAKEIRGYLGVDSLGYLSLEGMLAAVKMPPCKYCVSCWTGRYPMKGAGTAKNALEKKRTCREKQR
ncbi:MAG: amidophosphoribosyltransferase [Candidatus Omnitrophica bacterium]|nr:amidophosphoribosyltransferase [Candidatus Omnitrophota bacterium]